MQSTPSPETPEHVTALASRILGYLGTDADRLLEKYYGGAYTGSLYDELPSSDPDRITTEDVAAVALLSVPLSGPAVRAILWTHAAAIAALITDLPGDPLHTIEHEQDLQPLWDLQDYFKRHVSGVGVGHVRRSKLLARKRPDLIPIRDQYVLKALVDRTRRPYTLPLRAALRAQPEIVARLQELRSEISRPDLPLIRVLDVVVWMARIGDSQVPD